MAEAQQEDVLGFVEVIGGEVGGETLENHRAPIGTHDLVGGQTVADMLLFESNESDSFYFNDAAVNPATVVEVVSRRHELANGEGMAAVGRAGTRADLVKYGTFWNLTRSPKPNDLFCGPGYR